MVLLKELWGARILKALDGAILLADPFAPMRSEFEMEQLEMLRQSYEK